MELNLRESEEINKNQSLDFNSTEKKAPQNNLTNNNSNFLTPSSSALMLGDVGAASLDELAQRWEQITKIGQSTNRIIIRRLRGRSRL